MYTNILFRIKYFVVCILRDLVISCRGSYLKAAVGQDWSDEWPERPRQQLLYSHFLASHLLTLPLSATRLAYEAKGLRWMRPRVKSTSSPRPEELVSTKLAGF